MCDSPLYFYVPSFVDEILFFHYQWKKIVFVVFLREVIGSSNDHHVLNYLHDVSLGAFYFYGNNANL